MLQATRVTSPRSSGSSALLRVMGMPCACISARAAVLWPRVLIHRGLGPMKHSPSASTCSAKAAFSDRKP